MSSVDIAAIEERMKMASLDQLRGYAQNHYGEVQQFRNTEYVSQSQAGGYQILREPLWNKGTSSSPFAHGLDAPSPCRPCQAGPLD
jgi:malate dehydrogenase (oxaloacetate-decarboxylating)(NADP+)